MEQLLAAIKEIPPVKYALGVAGIAAAGALITGAVGYNRAGIIILAGTFVAMILLFIFANMVMSPNPSTTIPGLILLWVVILFFCSFLVMTITAFAFGIPKDWRDFLRGESVPVVHIEVQEVGPVFEPPIASSLNRPGRRTIDACISSPQFPQVAGMQCIRSAQKQIADAFCQAARFKFATDDFQTQNSKQFQASLKFTQEQGPDGLVGRWVEDDTGGSIFTRIVCTN